MQRYFVTIQGLLLELPAARFGGSLFRRRSCLCCVCVPFGPARANDFDDPRIMLFSGRDIWRNGAFAYGGLIVAPSGLDRDGLLLKVLLSGGLYRYHAQNLGGERVVGAVPGLAPAPVQASHVTLVGTRICAVLP